MLIVSTYLYICVYMYVLFCLDAASFQYEEYSEREDAAFAILAVILDEPATSSRDIEVTSSSSDDTATGELYGMYTNF